MKKSAVFSGAFLFLFLLSPRLFAWQISRYQNDVIVHENGVTTFMETIEADFTGEDRHGIYRSIPLEARDDFGNRVKTRLTVLSVTDENGRPWPYKTIPYVGSVVVRIGDPDHLVTGKKIYKIIYEVERGALRFFRDHDELFWNLIGAEWDVPILENESHIEIPQKASDLQAVAYEGVGGSFKKVQDLKIENHTITVRSDFMLAPRQGLTLAVGWSKGAVAEPSRFKQVLWWLKDNAFYAEPILIFILMVSIWNKKGRDPKTGHSITVTYEPPAGMTPAEVGALTDQRVDMEDITATVIDLAVKGYIKIEALPHGNYRLARVKDWEGSNLKPHEKNVLNGILGTKSFVQLSELKEHFYSELDGIHGDVFKNLIDAKLFNENPEKVRAGYFILGIAAAVGFFIIPRFLLDEFRFSSMPMGIAAVLSGLIIIIFGIWMPRRTMKGAEAADQAAGFSEFLKRVDSDRIKKMNDPSLFERCLPYAMALGFAEHWASVFQGIYTQPPAWYIGHSYGPNFSPRIFVSDMSRMSSSMGSVFVSQPSSSSSGFGGGGFVGGGGGGGGGGAW